VPEAQGRDHNLAPGDRVGQLPRIFGVDQPRRQVRAVANSLERRDVAIAEQHIVVAAGREKPGDHAADLAGAE